MAFDIYFGSSVTKFLKKADAILYQRIAEKLQALSNNPFPQDAKRVRGHKEKVFRVRIGDFRVLYIISLEKKEVLVINIDKRPRAYK